MNEQNVLANLIFAFQHSALAAHTIITPGIYLGALKFDEQLTFYLIG